MKVVFLMQDTGRVYGAEGATFDLAAGLRAAGMPAAVLLIGERRRAAVGESLGEELQRRGLEHARIEVAGRFSLRLVREIRREFVRMGGDVLHTVGYKADVHGGLAAGFGRRFPVVATVHGWLGRPDLRERFYGWLDLHFLARFPRVVALSHYYADFLVRRGVPERAVALIPSGLARERLPDVERAVAGLRADGIFTVGLVGRLSWEKNPMMFLDAARRAAETLPGGIRFIVVGEGPARRSLEKAVARAGLGGVVEMVGYQPAGKIFPRLHVLALCSRIENLPYSILEAMAWCRPVVATRVGGVPDLVADGSSGYLVESGDDAAMGETFVRLARDRGAVERLGRAGRARLEAQFVLEECIRRHRELYLEVGGAESGLAARAADTAGLSSGENGGGS